MNDTAQQSAEIRQQQIKMRRAEIKADLTAMRHAYVSGGVERPHSERTALEAEDAALALEAIRIGSDVIKAKAFRRMVLNAELLTQLLRLLDERGQWALALEAAERSQADLLAITPWRTEPQAAAVPA